ncbi:MAG: hypothetical protein FJ144_27215 [Deltaproteobacteria bacterium]|nr:hypothetical protein [Deltaproteobacteria bacterium]
MESVGLDAMAREAGERRGEPGSEDRESPLGRALESLGSTLTADQVKRIIARSEQPTAVLHAILESATVRPSRSTVERLVPVLMDAWNAVPRPELGGRSPEAVYRDAGGPTQHAGRNDPCPCGSGAKYKKCCLERNLH